MQMVSISYGKRKNILDKIGLWNPYYLLENQPTEKNKIRLYGNAFEEITPIKGLTIRAAQAIDAFDYRYRYVSLPADYNNTKFCIRIFPALFFIYIYQYSRIQIQYQRNA